MTPIASKVNKTKSVGDPCAGYESMAATWKRNRAILGGRESALAHDAVPNIGSNLLIPFSPTMSPEQYEFYKAEAELPGLVEQYARVLTGGLLRKQPQVKINKGNIPQEASEWLSASFGADSISIVSFLDEALWEEMQTSRAWIFVDYPRVTPEDILAMDYKEREALSPYCILYKADQVVNWRLGTGADGKQRLEKFTIRITEAKYTPGEHHPDYVDTVTDYYLNEAGELCVQKYERDTNETIKVSDGSPQTITSSFNGWAKTGEPIRVIMNSKPVKFIPAFPLNGSVTPVRPLLQPLIDREVGLYNRISRRNHLLYGAATYTPVVKSDMSDNEFNTIVKSGLGAWLKVGKGEDISALATPTDALSDMEKAIANTIGEMARMGARMLAPEGNSAESGVSLEIRNAGQTAQLGLLNAKASKVLEKVCCVMLAWKYGEEVENVAIDFTLSQDFNPIPLGADWMKLVTDWYREKIIPRSLFIQIAKENDLVPADYNDEDGVNEINSDPLVPGTATSTGKLDIQDLEVSSLSSSKKTEEPKEDTARQQTKQNQRDKTKQ